MTAAMTPEAFRKLSPLDFYARFASHGIRPDGRAFTAFRPVTFSLEPIGTTDASALARCGGTTAIAAVNLRLVEATEVTAGALVNVGVTLSPVAAPRFRSSGQPTGAAGRGQLALASASDLHVEDASALGLWVHEALTKRGGLLSLDALALEPRLHAYKRAIAAAGRKLPAPAGDEADEDDDFGLADGDFDDEGFGEAFAAGAAISDSAAAAPTGGSSAASFAAGAAGRSARAKKSLFWRLDVDVVVTTYDGNAADAVLLAACAAIASLRTPEVVTNDRRAVKALMPVAPSAAAGARAATDAASVASAAAADAAAAAASVRVPAISQVFLKRTTGSGPASSGSAAPVPPPSTLVVPADPLAKDAAGCMVLAPAQPLVSAASAPGAHFVVPSTFVSLPPAVFKHAAAADDDDASAASSSAAASGGAPAADPTTEEEDMACSRTTVCVHVPLAALVAPGAGSSAAASASSADWQVSLRQWGGEPVSRATLLDACTRVARERAGVLAGGGILAPFVVS